jgi:hypothetical protein
MPAPQSRLGGRYGRTTFWIGFGIIVFASVRNIVLDRLDSADLDKLPSFLTVQTGPGGKVSSTFFLLALGLLILTSHGLARAAYLGAAAIGRFLYQSDLPVADEFAAPRASNEPPSGLVTLDTAKYLPQGSHADFAL